jgi:hypothetical protein
MHPWAVLPRKWTSDLVAAREQRQLYRDHFRYVRAERRREFCAPWVLGQELGWRVASPVDITIGPLPQTEIDPGDAPQDAVRAAGRSELWMRERTGLAVERPEWLHLYQFGQKGHWENMFLPNGQGSVEWRLGWNVEPPDGYAVLVMPSDALPALGVLVGVLTSATLQRKRVGGFSLPICPRQEVTISRGQEIARIVLLHPDSIVVTSADL